MTAYTTADLEAIDGRCREIAAQELGFETPEVVYHLVRPEEVYFAAANGLPARYSSARWGEQSSATTSRPQAAPAPSGQSSRRHAARRPRDALCDP